jgi:hypothetical protein
MGIQAVAQLRRHLGQLTHGGDEPIAVTGNRDDEIVLVGALSERPAQRRDLARQVVLVHRGVRPDQVQQLIFADAVVSMFEQDDQHVEGLRRDGHEPTLPPQPPLEGIDDERTEGIDALAGRLVRFAVAHGTPLHRDAVAT